MDGAESLAGQYGLRYVHDNRPGFTRRRIGNTFQYFDTHDQLIADEKQVERIRSLAVPPAYKDVWICPSANGHIQATGIDEKGRKQYRYHPKWRAARDETKFEHILRFGEALPGIRRRVTEDIQKSGLPREKILATVVTLLEKTLIRIGNAEYAKNNHSYGLTTLRKKHIHVEGSEIAFEFMGKSGKKWNLSLHDRRIANVIKRCADLPGYDLFKYVDKDGTRHEIGSADVNHYLHEIAGEEFTAKDFRTWSGTVLAALALREYEKYDSAAQAKKNVLKAIENVSRRLGNTPAICRKCYIHPEVITAYMDGAFSEWVEQEIDATFAEQSATLTNEEIMVLAFLRSRLDNPGGKRAA